MIPLLVSKRGHQLAWSSTWPPTVTIVTVELSCKWYGLYLVYERGFIDEVAFPSVVVPMAGSCYVDHVPNPKSVEAWARQNQFFVDELALEIIAGRWQLEVLDA